MSKGKQGVWILLALALVSLTMTACTRLPKGQADLDVGVKERGIASWYGEDFHGWMTANGETYDMEAMTGAHRTLPLGTMVRVTNVQNGKQVRVRINDRGPYVHGRIIDLSRAAARKLSMMEHGISAVSLEVVGGHGAGFFEVDGRDLRDLMGMMGAAVTQIWHEVGSVSRDSAVFAVRGPAVFPGDLFRERRGRRVGDILGGSSLGGL